MSPYSHLRPSKARLFWDRWSHTFAYLFFCLLMVLAVWLVRNDLQANQRASERQAAALIEAKVAVSTAEAKAACERGNIIRQAINDNSDNMRFILEFYYEGEPLPEQIESRLAHVPLIDCNNAAVTGDDE